MLPHAHPLLWHAPSSFPGVMVHCGRMQQAASKEGGDGCLSDAIAVTQGVACKRPSQYDLLQRELDCRTKALVGALPKIMADAPTMMVGGARHAKPNDNL